MKWNEMKKDFCIGLELFETVCLLSCATKHPQTHTHTDLYTKYP